MQSANILTEGRATVLVSALDCATHATWCLLVPLALHQELVALRTTLTCTPELQPCPRAVPQSLAECAGSMRPSPNRHNPN